MPLPKVAQRLTQQFIINFLMSWRQQRRNRWSVF